LAFARWLAVHANEEGREPSFYLPSEYSHFEGALAFTRRLPRLVVTDVRVRTAGITSLAQGPVIFWPEGFGAAGTEEAWFRSQFDPWVAQVRSRPHVFLGYCSAARSTATELTMFMEHELGLRVQNYAMDFLAGPTIYEQIEVAARVCACGIFLFTNDDPLEGRAGAAPRDNVVFEAGFFLRANGRGQVAVIREEGAKMPADLGGNVYISLKERSDITPIHSQRLTDGQLATLWLRDGPRLAPNQVRGCRLIPVIHAPMHYMRWPVGALGPTGWYRKLAGNHASSWSSAISTT
jgi:Predicted nucleotide-binding protein containing TIR-like domain